MRRLTSLPALRAVFHLRSYLGTLLVRHAGFDSASGNHLPDVGLRPDYETGFHKIFKEQYVF
jgi:hypothetical protein